MNRIRRQGIISFLLVWMLLAGSMQFGIREADAVTKKPTINKNISVQAGKSQTIRIQKNGFKIQKIVSAKSLKRTVVSVKVKKKSVLAKGIKAGKAKVEIRIRARKSGKTKTYTLKTTVSVKEGKTKAERIFEKMSLEQKISQMLMPAFRTYNGTDVTVLDDALAKCIGDYGFAGVALFAENTKGTEQTVRLTDAIQKANRSVDTERPRLILSVDQEGGAVTRLATGTQMTGNMAIGATGSTDYATETGKIIGQEVSALGINMDFTPVLDVNSNPANPIIGLRSFSDDPETVATFGKAYLKGISSTNTISSVKHFPGHGDTATDSHTGLPLVDKSYEELKKTELYPYEDVIKAGTDMVMTAHIQYPQIEKGRYTSKDGKTGEIYLPATLSKTIITDILRKDMGFDGVVITDALSMGAIVLHFDRYDVARLAIEAGVDILLMPVAVTNSAGIADLEDYIGRITEMVKKGEIDKNKVNQAVLRILKLKEKHGLLDTDTSSLDSRIATALNTVGCKEHHDKEWEMAKAAVTLVKNSSNTLPIQVEAGRTLILNHDSDYTVGAEFALSKLKEDGIIPQNADVQEKTFSDKSIGEIPALVEGYKNVIITAGLGSSDDLKGQDADKVDAIIKSVHANNAKAVYISCRLPYDVARFQEADAILAVYLHKGMKAIPDYTKSENEEYGANVPAGIYEVFDTSTNGGPKGKLPVNIPKLTAERAFSDAVLYERGYGIV